MEGVDVSQSPQFRNFSLGSRMAQWTWSGFRSTWQDFASTWREFEVLYASWTPLLHS